MILSFIPGEYSLNNDVTCALSRSDSSPKYGKTNVTPFLSDTSCLVTWVDVWCLFRKFKIHLSITNKGYAFCRHMDFNLHTSWWNTSQLDDIIKTRWSNVKIRPCLYCVGMKLVKLV